MSWVVLRPQIETLLKTVTTLQEVSRTPKIKFDGYPAAHIVPSENSGDYETTSENIRTYAFTVRIFYETKSTPMEDALAGLEQVVDAVIDLFDQEDLKGGGDRIVGLNLPAKYTFINIFATPNRWGVLETEQLIMAEITVRVRISVDVT